MLYGFAIVAIAIACYTKNAWWLVMGAPTYLWIIVSLDSWAEKRIGRKYVASKEVAGGIGRIAGAIILLAVLVYGLFSALTSDGECNSGGARFGACE